MSSAHAHFTFYCHVGLLNQWKSVKMSVSFHAGAFEQDELLSVDLGVWRAYFHSKRLQLKTISSQAQE